MTNKPQFVGGKVKLGSLIKPAKVERCGKQGYPILSITKDDGIVLQSAKFKKRIASKDTSSYKVVPRGKLIQGIHIDEANFAIQNLVDWGIVSPAYKIWDIDSAIVEPEYLALALRSESSLAYYRRNLVGTVHRRGRMSNEVFYRLEVNLPPLQVQKRILAILGDTASQIEYAQQQIAQLDSLVKSRVVEMFGDLASYESRALKDCVLVIESGKSPKCLARPREGDSLGVLKLSAISSGVYKETENKALPSDTKAADGKVVCDGDILLARKNTPELVGQSVLVNHTDGNIMFPDIVFRMHVRPEVDEVYLSHALAYPLAGAIKSLAHGSAKSMSNIPKSELAKLLIPLPPLALQQEFAAFVAQADKSRFIAQQQIEKLQMLYDSLAQEYFGD